MFQRDHLNDEEVQREFAKKQDDLEAEKHQKFFVDGAIVGLAISYFPAAGAILLLGASTSWMLAPAGVAYAAGKISEKMVLPCFFQKNTNPTKQELEEYREKELRFMSTSNATFFSKESQSTLNKEDEQLIKEAIEGITASIEEIKEMLTDKENTYKWYSSMREDNNLKQFAGKDVIAQGLEMKQNEIDNLKMGLDAHTKRLAALNNIKDGKPITSDDQQLLLKMPIFNNTIISKYSLAEEAQNNKLQCK